MNAPQARQPTEVKLTDCAEGVRRRVYRESPELQRNAGKDRKGVAIIIDLKSVHGLAAGERLA